MILHVIKHYLASKDLYAQFKTARIMKHQGGLIFYHAVLETGIFKILEKPKTLDELARESGITDKRLLASLLDLGCSLREITRKNGKYRLKGAMAKALAGNVPLRELVRETVLYHADVARSIGTYLLENRKGDYLKDFGGVIAESSRILEPLIKGFIYHTIKKSSPLTILELGCGAGEYLKYYADINRNSRGTAIDIDPSAVAIARGKIKENKLESNFTVERDNIITLQTVRDRTFDLVTSYSNMHYFSDNDRAGQFSMIYKLLNKHGRFMLATGFKARSLSSSYYDLIFSATQGLYPLPYIDDIVNALKRSGFARVKTVSLMGRSFMGVVAYK
ncbi:MAG TPA: class I SAM-dependent methyltransferase [Spirochaetota bacterium]|nr:class I SAM-dependent methyltransferase [Spirochaetota bacterium]HPI89319.1 class I SAM-dependent methyltransferase [Spirochaetota bacterium]HPR49236.1 class I SAM-dependent methyltransferase [Spirochaetota bacterium]